MSKEPGAIHRDDRLMINIDELRQRVEAAEQRFGLVDSSQRQSSEKLIGMMNAIEQGPLSANITETPATFGISVGWRR